MSKMCCAPGCDRKARSGSASHCEMHYYRLRRTGTVEKKAKSYSYDANAFAQIGDAEAWLLGVIWSDGNLRGNRLHISSKDHEMLVQAEAVLGAAGAIRPYTTSAAEYLAIFDKEIADRLRGHGLHEAKSLTIQWPDGLPRGQEWHFVRGVFDGDGCAYVSREGQLRCEIVSASHGFIVSLSHFLTREGVRHSLTTVTRHRKNPMHRVTVLSREALLRFKNGIYGDGAKQCLNRKREVIEKWFEMPRRKIGRPTGIASKFRRTDIEHEVVAHYQKCGKSASVTAAHFSISSTTVLGMLNRNGVLPFSGRHIASRIDEDTKAAIRQARQNGSTFAILEATFGFGRDTLREVLRGE